MDGAGALATPMIGVFSATVPWFRMGPPIRNSLTDLITVLAG